MKILFVAENMNMNGANKSLVNLLGAIDPKVCQAELLLYGHTGPLLDAIPAHINLLPEEQNLRYFSTDLKTALLHAPLKIKLVRLWAVALRKLAHKDANRIKASIFKWVNGPKQSYDLAVGYCEGSTHCFVLDKTVARVKAGWLHVRLADAGINSDWEHELCQQLDRVVVVSHDSLEAAVKCGIPREKLQVIHNILPAEQIRHQADEAAERMSAAGTKLLTIGRLVWHKGIDILLDTCVYLKEKGFSFHWYVIGGGIRMKYYQNLAEQKNVADCVSFLGAVSEPYGYIAQCDIYVQPSRSEGWGMAITEAKILGKPVVTSDLPVFLEQITDGVNGLVSPLDPKKLGKHILQLAEDPALERRIKENMAREDLGYGEDVKLVYGLCQESL